MSRGFRITATKDGSRMYNMPQAETMRSNNRGTFKGHINNNHHRRGGLSFSARKIKQYLDVDVNMDGEDSLMHKRDSGSWRGRGRGSRRGNGSSRYEQSFLPQSKTNWYKVTIPHAKELAKDFILQSLSNEMNLPLVPVNFKKELTLANFYIKGHEEAVTIKFLNRKVTTPQGTRMFIVVAKADLPNSELTQSVLVEVKKVMSKRYVHENSLLNLCNLNEDADLKAQGLFISLSRIKTLSALLLIIQENISELRVLDLSDNSISYLDAFSSLNKATHLTHLNLSNNKINEKHELKNLKKLKLQELWLVGNPICITYKDSYIRTVRQMLPQLLRLDGTTLPPPINFDIDTNELPDIKPSYFDDGSMKDVICLFLQQYFGVYDSADRSVLAGAYHPNATFSLNCLTSRTHGSSQGLTDYSRCNRNLKKTSENDKISKIYCGADNIINVLKKLPSSLHVPDSFTVDISLVSQTLMIFSVQGLFIEKSSRMKRHFNKHLVTVPNAEGLAIMNEMSTISTMSSDLTDKYRKTTLESAKRQLQPQAPPQPQPQPPPQLQPQPPQPSVSSSGDGLTDVQRQMLATFSLQSGMNGHYSLMCLSGNDWSFQEAAVKFSELKASNGIPDEAFIKN